MAGKARKRRGADEGAEPVLATVAERTRQRLGDLSPSELKVARALLSAYPVAGLETVAEFAKRAHVSAPTVLRFVSRLGFDSYPAFQDDLIREVHEQMGSPLRQLAEDSPGNDRSLGAAAQHYVDVLSNSFHSLPEAEFARATALLSDPRMRIHLLGGRFSRVLADYLATHLMLVRKAVRTMPPNELERNTALIDLGPRDVLVLFDYRRYDLGLVEFARQAGARGAHVVLFTDPWMSPAAQTAEIVLPARVEAPSPFDSLVPAIAIVETLVAAVTERIGDNAHSRLAAVETIREASETTP